MRLGTITLLGCAGCSAILGFSEGHPRDEKNVVAAPDAGGGCDGSCVDAATSSELTTLASFNGAGVGHSMTVVDRYVYFTHDQVVEAASAYDVRPTRVIVSTGGEPRSITAYGTRIAWADGVKNEIRYCLPDGTKESSCSGTSSTSPDPGEPFAAGLTASITGDLLWMSSYPGDGGTFPTLRVFPQAPGVLHSIATLPGSVGALAAVAAATDGRIAFVMLGAVPYSVYDAHDGSTPVVTRLVTTDPPAPVVPAILVAGERVVWTRASGAQGGLLQCAIDPARAPAPCDTSKLAPLAAEGTDVTALAHLGNRVVWAELSSGRTDIRQCKVDVVAPGATPAPCTPKTILSGLARVTALALEDRQETPVKLYLYFLVADGGPFRLKRIGLPAD